MAIRTDCRFYKSDDDIKGCTALIRLFCKKSRKPCKFFKPKFGEIIKSKKG